MSISIFVRDSDCHAGFVCRSCRSLIWAYDWLVENKGKLRGADGSNFETEQLHHNRLAPWSRSAQGPTQYFEKKDILLLSAAPPIFRENCPYIKEKRRRILCIK